MNRIFLECHEWDGDSSPKGGIGTFLKTLSEQIKLNTKIYVIGFGEKNKTRKIDNCIFVIKKKISSNIKNKFLKTIVDIIQYTLLVTFLYIKLKPISIETPETSALLKPKIIFRNTKRITRLHGGVCVYYKEIGKHNYYKFYWALEKLNIINSDEIIAVSQWQKSKSEKLFKCKVDNVIYNPIPKPTAKISYDYTKKNVIFFGRFVEYKNINRVINAFCNLAKTNSGFTFKLIGKRNDSLSRFTNEAIPPNVKIVEFMSKDELQDELKNAAISVLPSIAEAFGYTIFESVAANVPTIISDDLFCGAAELLTNGLNCIKIDPYNQNEIEASIKNLLKNPKLRNDIAASCQDIAYEKLWAESKAKNLDLYLSGKSYDNR